MKENKSAMLAEISNHVKEDKMNKAQIMFELAECIAAAVDADDFKVYLVENEGFLTIYNSEHDLKRLVQTLLCF